MVVLIRDRYLLGVKNQNLKQILVSLKCSFQKMKMKYLGSLYRGNLDLRKRVIIS